MLQILKRPQVRPLVAAVLAVGALAGANQSWANTAATSTVRNIVTVNYANAAGTAQTALTAAVDVTVNLVKGAATLSAPVDITTAPGTNAVYAYTITNGANGISTYTLSTGTPTEVNISGSSASAPSSITLGATTVAAAVATTPLTGTFTITVPRDSVADGSINGIANGDTVVIGTRVFTVSGVADVQVPASPTNGPYTTTLTLNSDGTNAAIAVGTLIAERQSFNVTVTPGTMTSTTDATITVTLASTDGTNTANDTTVTTVAAVGLTVSKLVRNATAAVVGTGPVTYGGNTYYAGGVTGNPGDILEYLIVVTKSSSASSATGVKVSDPIPPFTTYVLSSMSIDNTGTGTFTALNDSDSNGDAGETDGNTVYFYPGTGGTDGAAGLNNGTGGTLGASAASRMKFRVTIQ
jgi:hypothetical protein